MTHNIITAFGRALFIFLPLFIFLSCTKEPEQDQYAQPTNRVTRDAVGDGKRQKAVADSFHTTGKENESSDSISHLTAANNAKVKELTEKLIEEYRKGDGRSSKTMKTVKFFRLLLTNDTLISEQKLLMIQDWVDSHPRYIGAQGALLCLYSNIIHDTGASMKDRATALRGCGEIYSSFYHDEEALDAFQMALSAYEQANDRLHMAKTLEDMGKLYAEHQNNEEQALVLFQRALEYGAHLKDYDPVKTQINVIQSLRYLNRLDDAERLVNEFIKVNPKDERLKGEKTCIEMMKGPPASRVFRGRNMVTIVCSDLEEIPGLQLALAQRNNLKTRAFLRKLLRLLLTLEQKEAPMK